MMDEKEGADLAARQADLERLLRAAEDAHEWAVWQLNAVRQMLSHVCAARAAEARAATTTTPPPKEEE